MKYVKKPVVIEAIHMPEDKQDSLLDEYAHAIGQIAGWCGGSVRVIETAGERVFSIAIETLEGTMTASPGDWIIKGVKGEFYPCKPDVFSATYSAEEVIETPVARTKQLRRDFDAILQVLKNAIKDKPTAERTLAMRKIQEGIMWLGMDLKEMNDTNPYPSSRDPKSPVVEPTADGLKL